MMMRHTPTNKRTSNRHCATSAIAAAAEKAIHIQPNVIARLMGIDAAIIVVPPATDSRVGAAAESAEAEAINNKQHISPPFRFSEHARTKTKCGGSILLPYRGGGGDPGPSSSRRCLKKLTVPLSGTGRSRSRQRRRHPQEDLLRKIRQDFQAWQQASSRAAPPDDVQTIAQENLRREKMARYGFAFVGTKKKTTMRQNNNDDGRGSEAAADDVGGGAGQEDGGVASADGDKPTPIVLLRPSTAADAQQQQSERAAAASLRLPKLERDGDTSRFLKEVKQRLQRQLRVSAAAGTDTTADEQISLSTIPWAWGAQPQQQPRKTARDDIATTVSRDGHGKRRLFLRSESFRAFRSDRRRSGGRQSHHASPEAAATVASPDKDGQGSAVTSFSVTSSGGRARSVALADRDTSPLSLSVSGVAGGQSFRSECPVKHDDDDMLPSPRALFRSLSAPESGLSFSLSLGRLFVLGGDGGERGRSSTTTGKHEEEEASSQVAAGAAETGKNGSFSFITGTVVSGLRRSFGLRRRTTPWSNKSKKASLGLGGGELHPQVAIGASPPSPETFSLFKVAQANLTELPPSPVSPLEVAGHTCSRHFFTDLHCTFPVPDLSPKCTSDQLGTPATANELSYRNRTDTTFETETACGRDKAYIREVLVAAGLLYDDDDGSPAPENKASGRVDSMARPICDDVFEEVEDVYYYRGEYCDGYIGIGCSETGGTATDHRMLFDLVNEALQSLVEGSKAGSSLCQWVVDSAGASRGRKLEDDVWQQVQALRNPQTQEMQTIDSMVAYEVRKSVWAEVLHEDAYVLVRKFERAIFDELVEDMLHEFFPHPDNQTNILF